VGDRGRDFGDRRPAGGDPCWPDSAYLQTIAAVCKALGSSQDPVCDPVTVASLNGCSQDWCRENRARIITLGRYVCASVKATGSTSAIMADAMKGYPGEPAYPYPLAKAVVNSSINVYCPNSAPLVP
jgi:Protein of unknown function (DUF732)